MKQTAIEWLVEQCGLKPDGKLVIQAKQMEKEQIIKAFIDVSEVLLKGVDTEQQGKLKQAAEQYYNETYKPK